MLLLIYTCDVDLSAGGIVSDGNWTEWSTIQGEIARVILKSDERN